MAGAEEALSGLTNDFQTLGQFFVSPFTIN